jgi:hypothetical protein
VRKNRGVYQKVGNLQGDKVAPPMQVRAANKSRIQSTRLIDMKDPRGMSEKLSLDIAWIYQLSIETSRESTREVGLMDPLPWLGHKPHTSHAAGTRTDTGRHTSDQLLQASRKTLTEAMIRFRFPSDV